MVLNQQISHTRIKIEGYLKDVQGLVDGNTPQKMSEFEAAKMIGLGTVVGKYAQKALALKNVDRESFTCVKQEFIDKVVEFCEKTKNLQESEKSLSSVYSKTTFGQHLHDPTLISGLNLLNTQYDLLETFPFVGISINLKRFAGSTTNPWLVHVQKIPNLDSEFFTKRVIDSVYLSKNPEYIQTHLSFESNAILPLFCQGDYDDTLVGLIETRLFKLFMTFNVMGNID